ncbi:MAG: hypothetical protein ISR58_05355 [Anaerolineales bacterium]|nr:hypothetical protein [Chloroflexota bacterium]MBL6980601.1 hypothetical protein [Anaerolineales bacterium]
MFTSEKIKEWLEEIEERPGSAPVIVQFIANRLKDLNTWNEELRAENIALRTDKRVDDYERQIAHLQYQLDLIKRQYGGQFPQAEQLETADEVEEIEMMSMLIYTGDGRIGRIELDLTDIEDGVTIGELRGLPGPDAAPRLLAIPTNEELLFLFASGRIATCSVAGLPIQTISTDEPFDWDTAPIPNSPQAGDSLVCLAPISRLALSDYFVQTSQRGFIKKIRMALASSIMENHYIGTGAKIDHDGPFALTLSGKDENFVLVTRDGYLRYTPVEVSPHTIVEAMRLKPTDRMTSAFTMPPDKTLLVMTQLGKAIQHTGDSLELVTDLGRVGVALYSKTRRDAGVRVVGAAAVAESDWGLALHSNGWVSLHSVSQILANGTVPVEWELSAFTVFSSGESTKNTKTTKV